MTTAYTSLLGLALPVTGELSGTWGDTVNNSITSLLDTAVAGTTTLSTDGDVTLTTTTGASNQARQAILLCSGARTAARNITAPAQSKIYTVINATTGGYSVVIRGAGPTTGVTVPAGKAIQVVWNGSDFVELSPNSITGNVTISGNLAVNGNTTLGDASADTVTVNGTVTSNLIFTDNTYDIGASGATRPRNLYLAGNAVIAGSTTLSGGTANAVAYLNASKVLTTGTGLQFNGTGLGVGIAPSTSYDIITLSNYTSGSKGFFLSSFSGGASYTGYPFAGYNIVPTNSVDTFNYFTSDYASAIKYGNGINFYVAASGSTGNPITFNQAMTLNGSGNWMVGGTTGESKANVFSGGSNGFTSGTLPPGLTVYGAAGDGYGSMISFKAAPGAQGISGIGAFRTSGFFTDLRFYTNSTNSGDSFSERARITAGGFFGLNTTSPKGLFDVKGGSLWVSNSSNDTALIFSVDSSSSIIQSSYDTSGAYTPLVFKTSESEKLRIQTTAQGGAVLVGTSSGGTYTFEVGASNGNAARIGILTTGRSGGDYPSVGYNTQYTAGGGYVYYGGDTAAMIKFAANGGRIETYTAGAGSSGNSISFTYGPYVAVNGLSWTNSSDERLKDIFEPIQNASQRLKEWRTVFGKLKTDAAGVRRVFFVAQDLLKNTPEVVDTSNPDELGVHYTETIPVVAAAVNEHTDEIASLKAIIEQLNARLSAANL